MTQTAPPQDAQPSPQSWREHAIEGVFWNSIFEVTQVLLAFVSMLVVARLIPPAEYGRFVAVTGLTGLVNVLSCGQFMAQALQLPDGVEPDWSEHWYAAIWIQLALIAMAALTALLCWHLPAYRSLAGLLLFVGLTFGLDTANLLGTVKLRREMRFRRLRLVHAAGAISAMAITMLLAWWGWGAWAIVLGNALNAVPFTVDLLWVQRWRPSRGWWAWPDWRRYRGALTFGFRQGAAAALYNVRTGAEALLLTASLGVTPLALWSRAQGLYRSTVGRAVPVVMDAVYPVLPRYAARPAEYPRQATLVLQMMLWFGLPSTVFLGLEGRALSRLFYGMRWVAADSLLWPGALLGLGALLFTVVYTVLLAANRLRSCTRLDIVSALALGGAVLVAQVTRQFLFYAWVAAAVQVALAGLALFLARDFLIPRWWRGTLAPPLAATVAGAAALALLAAPLAHLHMAGRLAAAAASYLFCCVLVLRWGFADALTELLRRLPLSRHLLRWLRLAPSTAA